MKRAIRQTYLELAWEVDTNLCAFCKFMESFSCGEMSCMHPLRDRFPDDEYPSPGDDCWGFRPAMNLSLCADIVGIVLAKGWDDWEYTLGNKPTVAGRKGL